eukprot:516816-Pleurochrysis_carterae.AAC.1
MAAFAQAPSDGRFASPMRWTFYKAHATDLWQGPCDGPYGGYLVQSSSMKSFRRHTHAFLAPSTG